MILSRRLTAKIFLFLQSKKRKSLFGGEYIFPRSIDTEKGKGVSLVIKLTKFNSETNQKGEFVLNAEIIETIEETPDTVVTLTNGKKLLVEESMDDIIRRVMKYRRAMHQF